MGYFSEGKINWLRIFPQIYGELGYSCLHELCLPIPSNDGVSGLSINSSINAIGFAIPTTIILISYCKIWLQSRQSRKAPRNMNVKTLNKRSHEDAKLGISMLLTCFSFIFFSFGIIVLQSVLESETKSREVSTLVLCLYWSQFYSNFIVYSILNKHYRKAFYFFMHNVLFCGAFRCQDEN